MYKLILTESERAAFNWIGNRYSNGTEMAKLIQEGNDVDSWNAIGPVLYDIPECAAWQIAELAAEDDFLFPCFAEELTRKMRAFLDSIV